MSDEIRSARRLDKENVCKRSDKFKVSKKVRQGQSQQEGQTRSKSARRLDEANVCKRSDKFKVSKKVRQGQSLQEV